MKGKEEANKIINDINEKNNYEKSQEFNYNNKENDERIKNIIDDIKYIKEKKLNNYPDSIQLESLKIISNQMMKSICKITKKEKGTGFFCKIPFPDECQLLKVLITNNHVLGEEDIIDGNIIPISLNNDIINLEIQINNSRKRYTNPIYDITIIEILASDNIAEFLFLDIDNQIYLKDDPNKIFHQNSIYLLHYPSDNIEYSIGVIKSITLDESNNIQHLCNTEKGSSGSPIMNLNNYKVIGIHKGSKQGQQNWNLGTFIKKPIDEFNNIFKPDIILNGNKIGDELKEHKESNLDNDFITIKYKVEKNRKIKLLGEDFVANNKYFCKLIINEKEFDLMTFYNIENLENEKINDEIFEIKLKGIKRVTNMSHLFYECSSLFLLPDMSNWNTSKVINMSHLFYECSSLSFISDLSNWDTKNVNNMRSMFYGCSSLKNMPNISTWNTGNVTNISYMFGKCSLIKNIPDISFWNIDNIINMSGLFSKCSSLLYLPNISKWKINNNVNLENSLKECSSLKSLPDISNWNTKNVLNMSNIFNNCSSLKVLPDLSKWNTENVTDMHCMFLKCKSLNNLPDISNWNTNNVIDMSSMFEECISLKYFPDISIWNIGNVTDIGSMFTECLSIKTLPDISKWNVKNVQDMSMIFYKCRSLKSLPNISKWNTENVTRMDGMFCQCHSLMSLPDISGWNTKNVTDISVMFADCRNLPYPPNISNWNIDKVINKDGIFQNCSQSQNNIKNCYII